MSEPVQMPAKLLTILAVKDADDGAVIVFKERDAGGRLQKDHPFFVQFKELAEICAEEQSRLAVTLDPAGRVQDLALADRDVVRSAAEIQGDDVEVTFLGHSGIYKLQRGHPDFGRILERLTQSQQSQGPVWFGFDSQSLAILDVVADAGGG